MKRFAIMALVALLSIFSVTPAFAVGETWTTTLNLSVPFGGGKAVLGTLVVRDIDFSGTQPFTFNGQVGGQPASVAGVARLTYTGGGYQGEIVQIDSWSVPGVSQPALPIPLAVTQGAGKTASLGATASVAGASTTITLPVSYSGVDSIPAPGSGTSAFAVTNVAGAPVLTLPRTGEPFEIGRAHV